MTNTFDKDYWEDHWQQASSPAGAAAPVPNPYLVTEIGDLTPGTALDAGCGEGVEANWLAAAGWQVTAADISDEVLTRAAELTAGSEFADRLQWVQADLSGWQPDRQFDLVTTHYAHPAMPQLDFYERIADWVAPGGTLLIVGHLHTHGDADDGIQGHRKRGHGGQPPAEASATVETVTARFAGPTWQVVTAEEHRRTVGSHATPLQDVVVRLTRRR